jgi:hypothetical protein
VIYLQESLKAGDILRYKCQDTICWSSNYEMGGGRDIWSARVDSCPGCGGTHFFIVGSGNKEFDDAVSYWLERL